jgi:MFS family permease
MTSPTDPSFIQREANQFALLNQRRFGPFFWTVMVTYQLSVSWLPVSLAGLVIGALFILPYLLFSATSGQLAEKYEHTVIMRWVKNCEIGIMVLAAVGFLTEQAAVLLLCTFLMGLHSTVFGPVKYSYLPRVLDEHELTGGNGMTEMGTFVAILLGNVAGGLLVAMPEIGHASVALACVAVAVFGRWMSGRIPSLTATHPDEPINWNPITETLRNLTLARANAKVFQTLLGISWMWFFGAVFLSQFPSFAKEVLHGDAQVASLLLVLFSVGIGAGSLLCEYLSRGRVEIGLAPLGAVGMTLFAVDLYVASSHLVFSELMGIQAFISHTEHWRIMADLFLLSLFTGIYSVPMYALIQIESKAHEVARIIAANNIINALFMIASSLIAGVMMGAGATVPDIFFWTGVANAVVTLAIFLAEPSYLHRFAAWLRGV